MFSSKNETSCNRFENIKGESTSGKSHKEMIAINVYESLLYFNVNIRPWAPYAPKGNVWDR